MFGFYIVLTLVVLFVAFMGRVIGHLIGKYWGKKQRVFTYLNITIGEKEFDEVKQGKVKIVRLHCIPRWFHTLIVGVKAKGHPYRLEINRFESKDGRNGELHIQYGRSIDHFFRKVDYVQISCLVGSQIRSLVTDCAGFSIETTQTKKDNGFIEYKPKNFVVHLK